MPSPTTAGATVRVSAVPARAGIAGDSVGEVPVAALAERVGDFNVSMDPWERTGAAPQGWAPHLHQTVIPVQGYIQLRPHDAKASPSVSIFSRAPLCPNTCRHCRSKPCDIATDHDDHICYNCEQRLLFPERIPKWETQNLPICDFYGVRSAPLNDAAHEVLTNTTYACSANDEELFSSPPMGARTHGPPMMTDCNSLSAIIGALTYRSSVHGERYLSGSGCHLIRHAMDV